MLDEFCESQKKQEDGQIVNYLKVIQQYYLGFKDIVRIGIITTKYYKSLLNCNNSKAETTKIYQKHFTTIYT